MTRANRGHSTLEVTGVLGERLETRGLSVERFWHYAPQEKAPQKK